MVRHALVALFAVLLTSPLAASPCTNDNWQPTFVHDLENEDGPWYVSAQMGFTQLRWVPNGGYVPHACELVPNVRATRNPRGYTNCQEYTRIQCGCSRAIPGNSTCAAFLASHPAKVVPPAPPGAPAAGGGGGGGGGSVAPPVPTIPPPAPTPGPINVPGSGFQRAPQYSGAISPQGNAISLTGGAWTNGRLKNGVYDGNRIYSSETFDFSAGGDVYMRLVVNGAGQYMGFWPRVLEGVSVNHMSTHHSWANSVVVKDNETIFAHVHVAPGGAYGITIARGGYGDAGGQVIYSNTGKLPNPRTRLDLQFGDNYAGTAASIAITETIVRAGAATTSTTPPTPPQTQGQRSNLPAGAACSTEAECASSICLLGVCAPAQ